tara:strand:- start:373 stop:1179 length:807 start_codon:yes stop_codon:yes gene_type:complete
MTTSRHPKFGYLMTDKDKFRYFSKVFVFYQIYIKKYWEATQSEDWDDVEVLPESFRLDYLDNQYIKDYEERHSDDEDDEDVPFEIELSGEVDLVNDNSNDMEFDFSPVPKKEKLNIFNHWMHLERFKKIVENTWNSQDEYTEDFMVEFMNKKFMDVLNSIESVWESDDDHRLSIYVKDEFIEDVKAARYEQTEERDRRMELEFMDEDDDDDEEEELIYPEQFDVGRAPYFWMSLVPEEFKRKWFFEKYPDIKEEWLRIDFKNSIGCDG